MKKTLIALSLLTITSTSFANSLMGICTVEIYGEKSQDFSFNLEASKRSLQSQLYSVEIPLEDTYNDDYFISVSNTIGINDAIEPNAIKISVENLRYFCNPPVLQNNGGVSRTPCDRPKDWVTISDRVLINDPQVGETLSFIRSTPQVSFSCKAVFYK